ncbi:hypothetical protein, partial [Streptomyces rhizosphaericus]|uniref:hypothetical protein n=1 Tax=Streptomyces rhizosphaericus TaxID=114699 RepID=UPI0031E0BD27
NECDALAISSDGTLEAIEVKPLRGGSIAWVAAQALMYSRLLATWVEYVADEPDQVPGRVLREMAEQRAAMGLAPRAVPTLPDRPTVIPVVAVQRGASPTMVSRMLAVRDALAASEHSFPRVKIFEVSLTGELIELDESRTATGKPRPLVTSWAARHNAAGQEWKARTP